MENLVPYVAILLLSAVTEALVEFLAKPIIKLIESKQPPTPAPVPVDGPKPPNWFDICLQYIAAAVGIGLCVLYKADLLALAGLYAEAVPWIGAVVTGALIGRGANFINDFAGRYLDKPRS
ncbi:MAG TPA: hypothetical protein PLN42_00340 [Anaerolineae bacterium]|nr:hypothetical protein [Anaerolineae bacterium]